MIFMNDKHWKSERKIIEQLQKFFNKEEAIQFAIKANKQLDDLTSVWQSSKNNEFVVIQTELREIAALLGYKEVVNRYEIFRKHNN